MNGFSKFFTKERIIILVAFLILTWALCYYSNSKNTIIDRFSNPNSSYNDSQYYNTMSKPQNQLLPQSQPQPQPQQPQPQQPQPQPKHNENNSQNIAKPSDLLPKDDNSHWATKNPNTPNTSIMTPDLLIAGYNIGIDTIGQSLRNPNYQLRSDPIIQKMDIGPWNLSTIEPDIGRVPLEIGASTR